MDVGGVDQGRAGTQPSGLRYHLDRGPAVHGEALLVLGRLLRGVEMQGRVPIAGPVDGHLDGGRIDGSHRVHRRADPHCRIGDDCG